MLSFYLSLLETAEDQRRFQILYEAYEKRVFAVTLRILDDSVRAEDAAQQTWLSLLKNWERVSTLSREEIGGYIVTVAKNAAIDLIRVDSRTIPFPDTWDMPDKDGGEDGYAYLVSLIREMPEGYRRIMELKCVEERSNREIARRLRMNESTVATRVQRGRTILRERLEKEGFRYA